MHCGFYRKKIEERRQEQGYDALRLVFVWTVKGS